VLGVAGSVASPARTENVASRLAGVTASSRRARRTITTWASASIASAIAATTRPGTPPIRSDALSGWAGGATGPNAPGSHSMVAVTASPADRPF
jgi:hypothetical protein